jgi:aminopeptidase
MKLMRADMGGAATVTSAAWAIAKLGIPIDMLICTPLTGQSFHPSRIEQSLDLTSRCCDHCAWYTPENMPSGHATKPGDIIYAMNGKSIEGEPNGSV